MNLLHITDFHIHDTDKEDYPLTDSNYQTYIQGLKSIISEDIDALVITGDVFNKGNLDDAHLKHASNILDYIRESMGIPLKSVFMCPGEHDFTKDYDKKIVFDKDNNFKLFRDDKCLIEFEIESAENGEHPLDYLNEPADDEVLFLMLDSIYRTDDVQAKNTRCETLIKRIENKVLTSMNIKTLIIGSHYPMTVDLVSDEMVQKSLHGNWGHPYWYYTAHILLEGLSKISAELNIICLSGDMHVSKVLSKNIFNKKRSSIDFFSTNALALKYEHDKDYSTQQSSGVRVIHFNEKDKKVTSSCYVHMADTHQSTEHEAFSWKKIGEDVSPERNMQLSPTNSSNNVVIHDLNSIDPASKNASEDNLESMIINSIESNQGRYKLGRFSIHEDITALGWISITPILSEESIISLFVNNISKTIQQFIVYDGHQQKKNRTKFNINECILVGLNFWGASIACQVSLLTGIRNQCISVEGGNINNMAGEGLSSRIFTDLSSAKCIIFITDVISSGNTIVETRDKILQNIPDNKKKWLTFSLICDECQQRDKEKLKDIEFYSGCRSLKIPILSTDKLPSENVLPCDMKF